MAGDEISKETLSKAIQALKEHPAMIKDPKKFAAMLGRLNEDHSAEGKKQAHDDSTSGADPEGEDSGPEREGKDKQTRMVPIKDSGEPPQMKKQVWLPGQGKGWCDADKVDAANAKGAGHAPNEITMHPEGDFDDGYGEEGDKDFRPPSSEMAQHQGNYIGVENDTHPDWKGADGQPHHDDALNGEGITGRHFANATKDHPQRASGKPFTVDADSIGVDTSWFGGAGGAGGVKAEDSEKKYGIGSKNWGLTQAEVESKGQRFPGAANWLKQTKAGLQSDLRGRKEGREDVFRGKSEDIKRRLESGSPTAVERLANMMRGSSGRNRVGGQQPQHKGHANFQDELWRRTPKSLRAIYATNEPEHAKDLNAKEAITNTKEKKNNLQDFANLVEKRKKELEDQGHKID